MSENRTIERVEWVKENKLVFFPTGNIQKDIPVTDSKQVAEKTGLQHNVITRNLRKNIADFEEFGELRSMVLKTMNPKGGGAEKIYLLNEGQALLLFTHLRNSPIVRDFKKRLVKAFLLAKSIQAETRNTRASGKPARKELTDVIKEFIPESPNKNRRYKHFTDLIYKKVFNLSYKELTDSRGVRQNQPARDYMTKEELRQVEKIESLVCGLIQLGYRYGDIKEILARKQNHEV